MKHLTSYAPSHGRCIRAVRQWLVCLAVGLSPIVAAQAQTQYAVTDLGVLPGSDNSAAAGINSRGQVVGACSSSNSSFGQQAFVWENGQMRGLGKLSGGIYSYANAINASGTVVGDGDTGNYRPQSWVATAAGLLNIFPNSGGNTHAVGINDTGAICGYYTKSLSGNTSGWKGAIWTPDPKDPRKYRTTDLPVLPGINPKYTQALPFGFNQAGQAAGWAVNDIISQHAAFWNNDAAHSIVDLGTLPGDWTSIAWGLNDLGQVVGESHPPGGSIPVLWNNDAAHTPSALPLLPGDDYGAANAVNNLGQVLGTSAQQNGPVHPVLWANGQAVDLQFSLDLVSGAGWTLLNATAINDLGQIVGNGLHNGQVHAVLLAPLP